MVSDPNDLLGFLQEQIKRRESFREEIGRSIEILREAEKELRRILPGGEPPAPPETPDDLPYRLQAREEAAPAAREPHGRPPASPRLRWEEPAPAGGPASPLERPLSTPRPRPPESGERPAIPQPLDLPQRGRAAAPGRSPMPQGVDEILQAEQMLLLGVDDVTSSRRTTAPIPSPPSEAGPPAGGPLFPPEAEAPPPAPDAEARAPGVEPKPSRPAAPPGSSVQKLMDHIRQGGAVRCVDPWNRTCAAFVFRANGSAVFATDVFANYLRSVFSRFKPERPGDPASGLMREAEPQVRFLAALVEALQTQRLITVRAVRGLQLSGGRPRLPSGFEFEASTRGLMHAPLLERLQAVLQKPIQSFFLPEGPYAEVRAYLAGYQAFCKRNNEESRAAVMLVQLGLAEAPPASAAPADAATLRATPGGNTLEDVPPPPGDTGLFLDETEELQDLNTFDFSPEDQKSILSQKEDAFSMSTFRRIPGPPPEKPAPGAGEEPSSPIPGPAADRAEAGKDEEIRNFLKNLGVEWKG